MPVKKKVNGFTKYTTYNWSDHDPIIDVLDTARQSAKMTTAKITEKSRVAPTTMTNWWSRKTKRPQMSTVAAVAVALGMDNLPITAEARRKFRDTLK